MHAFNQCLIGKAKAADDHKASDDALAARIQDGCSAELAGAVALMNKVAAATPGMERSAPPTAKDRLALASMAVKSARGEPGGLEDTPL